MTDTDAGSAGVVASVEPPTKAIAKAPDPGVAITWSEDVGQQILEHVASGKTWRQIAAMPAMPSVMTMFEWRDRHPEWANGLARARKAHADELAAHGKAILEAVDPDSKFGSARVQKANSLANYDQWLAKSYDRDTYGERPTVVAVQVNTIATAFGKMAGRVEGEA